MPYSVKIAERLNMQGILAQFISFCPKWGGGSFLNNIYIGPRGTPPPRDQKSYVISNSLALRICCARFLRAHAFLGENFEKAEPAMYSGAADLRNQFLFPCHTEMCHEICDLNTLHGFGNMEIQGGE